MTDEPNYVLKHNWVFETSDDGQYAYLRRTDKPGHISVKAEDEAFVVDVWDESYTMGMAACHAFYGDLETSPLLPFTVLYREPDSSPLEHPLIFHCQAENGDHAEEQCLNAYPYADPVWVSQTDNGDTALEEYYA